MKRRIYQLNTYSNGYKNKKMSYRYKSHTDDRQMDGWLVYQICFTANSIKIELCYTLHLSTVLISTE